MWLQYYAYMKVNDSIIRCGEVIYTVATLYYDMLETVSNDSVDKKQKIIWIIMFYYTIFVVKIYSLLLIIIAINCYYYITLWLKQKMYYYINNTKMVNNNESKEINIKNHTCYYFDGIIKTNDPDSDNTKW